MLWGKRIVNRTQLDETAQVGATHDQGARTRAIGISVYEDRCEATFEFEADSGIGQERIRVTGDLKLEPPGTLPVLAPDLARVLGSVPLIVAGSTHEAEETAALESLAAAEKAGLAAALVLAPRRPARADAVAAEAERAGRRLRRRSTLGGAPLAAGEVLLLDGIGDLAAVYTRAGVAFVGERRSWAPQPARARTGGRAGPVRSSTANARDAADLVVQWSRRKVASATDLATPW
jgi:hypothetical protein